MDKRRIEPGPGQESVWDYPRPPKVEGTTKHIQVIFNKMLIADTRCARRVLETSHPPVYYIPPGDIRMEFMIQTDHSTFCEWKGRASYYSINVGNKREVNAAWLYPNPAPAFSSIKDYVAFYPGLMEACLVDGEKVFVQPGDFYGGWITSDIVGPFKGGPGTWGW